MSLKHCNKDSPFPPFDGKSLRIYSMRFCPFAKRTRLVVEHKNIPYEVVNINLSSKPSWFLEKNPVGTVPTLEQGEVIITDSVAACEWLDDVYPSPRLTPGDPYLKAQDRMLFLYCGKLSNETMTFAWDRKQTGEEALAKLVKYFKIIDDALDKREGIFFGGISPSLLDFYLIPHFEDIGYFAVEDSRLEVKDADYPKLAKWYSLMLEVPAVKKLHVPSDIYLHFFNSAKSGDGKADYDEGL